MSATLLSSERTFCACRARVEETKPENSFIALLTKTLTMLLVSFLFLLIYIKQIKIAILFKQPKRTLSNSKTNISKKETKNDNMTRRTVGAPNPYPSRLSLSETFSLLCVWKLTLSKDLSVKICFSNKKKKKNPTFPCFKYFKFTVTKTFFFSVFDLEKKRYAVDTNNSWILVHQFYQSSILRSKTRTISFNSFISRSRLVISVK